MKRFHVLETTKFDGVRVDVLKFQLPLSYPDRTFEGKTIQVIARLCQLNGDVTDDLIPKNPNIVAFIQGGPGFPCSPPSLNMPYTKTFLSRGYQVLYMDQRGTGLSTPLDFKTFSKLVPPKEDETKEIYISRQLEFILNFTGASIVEDLELIRSILIGDQPWSISGQSFGGFCSFTYLSRYPKSIKRSFITGGVPPINHKPEDVYRATFQRAKDRNNHYYSKYPQDISMVKEIVQFLDSSPTVLPNGGKLTVDRFQHLGINFGGHGGTDQVHLLVQAFYNDLQLFKEPTNNTLLLIQSLVSFGTNILYALFQESIYCDGNNPDSSPSKWSAHRVRNLPENSQFNYNQGQSDPIYFTTEMVFPQMFEDYIELNPFRDLAHAIHSNTSWPILYDTNVLSKLDFKKVPIVGAVYVNDLYVEFHLVLKVLQQVFNGINFRPYITNEFFHNGYRQDPERVMGNLFRLLESEVD